MKKTTISPAQTALLALFFSAPSPKNIPSTQKTKDSSSQVFQKICQEKSQETRYPPRLKERVGRR